MNLPLACDFVLARRQVRPRFLDVGIHPGGGHLWRLAGRVGEQGAAALVLCGDTLSGPRRITPVGITETPGPLSASSRRQ